MQKRIGVIFVSRRNSLRSILAEACLAHLDPKRFSAMSCGQPGHVGRELHPAAVGALHSASIPVPTHAPRGWDELARSNGTVAEFVITLDAATESRQPSWPGQPDAALWDYPDVAAVDNPEKVAHDAIQLLFSLRRRLELLVSLPLHGGDRAAVRSDVRDLGYMR
ncbi:protein tyrosine phosphatase [Variovorax sp. J22G73]|jgi:protein-tyrosine-phosphatase|uniref:arsenate-mycothiol transferase ArsC n=1 Tax=unclassified Variovorax TaxID=663243 RepID=UPI000D5F984D|nr:MULTISPECIES: protein tyrosine phosphatase [unclassified Variovorax]MDM0006628.1 protein tyrosine phosphatase [Variovorax sp. J22R203]MDM0097348.1 protein tyrosine phosphatase [Variovorax sp. J22G73]